MQEKHVPMRKCIGCGEMIGKKGAVRVVRSKDGELSVDLTGKKAGRIDGTCQSAKFLPFRFDAEFLQLDRPGIPVR